MQEMDARVVYLNDPSKNMGFCDNKVVTAKYTKLNFIPRFFYGRLSQVRCIVESRLHLFDKLIIRSFTRLRISISSWLVLGSSFLLFHRRQEFRTSGLCLRSCFQWMRFLLQLKITRDTLLTSR